MPGTKQLNRSTRGVHAGEFCRDESSSRESAAFASVQAEKDEAARVRANALLDSALSWEPVSRVRPGKP